MRFATLPHVAASAGVRRDRGPEHLLPLLLPFMLIPTGAIYCQIHELLFEEVRSSPAESLVWAVATLAPWVAAALAFQGMAAPGEQRRRVMRRALLLGLAAWMAGSSAAMLFGSGFEQAFYSRLPLLAAALVLAAIYPIPGLPRPADLAHGVAANENGLPIAPAEIVYAQAAGNYVELHAGERVIIWRQTMRNAERILAPEGFVRVHRSYLVPLRSIKGVARGRKGPVALSLRNGRQLPVSNRYAANLHDQAA